MLGPADTTRVVVAALAVLASFAPFTAFCYASCADYPSAILFNGAMSALGWVIALLVVRPYYAPLIARDPMHRYMLHAWVVLYAFVGVQMGWVLRPLIGAPNAAVTFFRQEAWGNAYVVIGELIGGLLGR